jgi:transposase
MAVFVGLDVHRAQITFDALDTDSGEVRTGKVRPGNRHAFRLFLQGLDGADVVAAVEAMTGWRFVVEELQRIGAEVHLAEPAEVSTRRDRKRRAKTDRLGARLLRELLMERRLPEAWIPPSHLLDLRAKVRLRKTLVNQRTEWLQRIHAVLFHHGVAVEAGRLGRLEGERLEAQLAALELPEAARQQITVARALITELNAQLHTLELEFERIARRMPGCRALMSHYGIGPRVASFSSVSNAFTRLCWATKTPRSITSSSNDGPTAPAGRRRPMRSSRFKPTNAWA